MITNRLSRLLTAYVDGELTGRQRKAVARLLKKSGEARKLYRKIKRDSLILRRLPKRTLHIDLADTIMDRITQLDIRIGQPIARPAARLPLWRSLAAAAILFAVAAGSYVYFAQIDSGAPNLAEKQTPEPRVADQTPPKSVAEPDADAPKPYNPNSVFAFPNLKIPQFQLAQTRVPFLFALPELDADRTEQLKLELKKDPSYRIDLFTADTATGLDRLCAAAKTQGFSVQIDRAAQARINRRLSTTFALYVENVTPDEMAGLLARLSSDDKKQGASEFAQVVVSRTQAEEIAKVLGGSAKDFDPPSQRPLDQGTAAQIIQILPGEKAPERAVIVVPYQPPQAAPFKEVKKLLDGYRQSRNGTVQMLLVLWGNQ